ncbi:MAG: rhomboid family intramembrane serine protease [Planctomycetota bacterium]|nr:rhomboid family intramembrane serine protease [Planctomycetota bacterium]MDA1112893.1 rhomboid family intramembrane serine protease [Planctomycetota bacterium]
MIALTPIVRRLLILWAAIWVVDFLLSLWTTGLSSWFWLDPAGLLRGEILRIPGLVGYTFLHAPRNLFHLLMNAWMFALFAPEIERLFPGKRFVVFLLQAALAGAGVTLLLAWMMPQQFALPVVGASGLVSAVLAASAAMYPDRVLNLILIRLRLLYFFFAVVVIDLLWLIANMANQGDGTANAVHLAGALSGWIAVGGFQRIQGPWSRIAENQKRKSQQKTRVKQIKDDARMDQILAKISREGMPSLSNEEKQFLKRQSEKKSR